MIFNPFDIQITSETAVAGSGLPWANPMLIDNMPIVLLTLFFLLIDILACCRKGVMRHEWSWIIETHSVHTYEAQMMVFPWIKPLLMLQVFFYFGLSLYCLLDSSPAAHLLDGEPSTWLHLLGYTSALIVWYLLQAGLFNWFCYLFGLKEKCHVMNHTFNASFAIFAPFATLAFIGLIAGYVDIGGMMFLLATLFILSQIVFILSGFRIFYDGLGSVCLLFAYLCTLEIAPLWVLWAKITTLQA